MVKKEDRVTEKRAAAWRRQVTANENEVIAGALQADPNDTSPRTAYLREVAEDIIARRAAGN